MEIKEISRFKNGKIRIILEGGVSFQLYKKEASAYDFREGDFVSEELWLEIKKEILLKRAKKRAMYLLQKMDRTEKQLRDKLHENEYPEDVIDEAIAYVSSFHYIDDRRYAVNYVQCYQDKKSKMQMRMDLLQRGISNEDMEYAFEEELTVSPEKLIRRWLVKKNYDPSVADDGERRRIYQFLLRKGFRSDEILRCMKLEEY